MRVKLFIPLLATFFTLSSSLVIRRDVTADEELPNLQNVLTVISTDLKTLDASISTAKSITGVASIVVSISKLNQTIGVCNTLLDSTQSVSADLASTLQTFGSQLATQLIKTLDDLVDSKPLVSSVANGRKAVLAKLLAVYNGGQIFIKSFETKVPSASWSSAAAPQVAQVLTKLNATIDAYRN
jgi:hypothetical protein